MDEPIVCIEGFFYFCSGLKDWTSLMRGVRSRWLSSVFVN